MSSRHRARERAVQILYLRDMRGQSVDEATEDYYETLTRTGEGEVARGLFTEELVNGVATRGAELDALIKECSRNWRLERMAPVERNILRIAVYEMAFGGTPPAVAIDEALRLAQRYSGEAAVSFVNGVLDAVKRSLSAGKR